MVNLREGLDDRGWRLGLFLVLGELDLGLYLLENLVSIWIVILFGLIFMFLISTAHVNKFIIEK
jgi:hypothetical protein